MILKRTDISVPHFLNKRSKSDLLKSCTQITGDFLSSWLELEYEDLLRMAESLESMNELLSLPNKTVKKLELLCSPALSKTEFLMLMVDKAYLREVKSTRRRLDNQRRLVKSLECQVEQLERVND